VNLSRLSKSLVAAALAATAPYVEEARATPSGSVSSPARATWHAFDPRALVARYAPVPPDTVGLYLQIYANGFDALRGPAFADACKQTGAACQPLLAGTVVRKDAQLIAVTARGDLVWITWRELGAVTGASDVERAVLAHVVKLGALRPLHLFVERRGGRLAVTEGVPPRLLGALVPPPQVRSRMPPPRDDPRPAQEHRKRWLAALAKATISLGATVPNHALTRVGDLDDRHRAALGKGVYELDAAVIAKLPPVEQAIARALQAIPSALGGWVTWAPIDGGWLVSVLYASYGCPTGRGLPPAMVAVSVVVEGTRATPLAQVTEQNVRPPYCHPFGRRPPGLVEPGARADADACAAYLAEAAHLEAASVPAFLRLADELAALAAPADLVARARAAADDEVRHARVMAAHAAAAGATVAEVELAPVPARDAFALALDNAIEGCVHEAFAAVLARFGATTARDATLAADLETIAEDEARHGDLAWAIARWLEPRLSADERARVEQARAAALRALPRCMADDAGRFASGAARLGVPSPAQARELAVRFAVALERHA
jgi:hypothetical protein